MEGSESAKPEPVSEEMARQVMRQGELFLQAQLQSAIASDHRALTVAAFLASIGAAIAAGAIGYWTHSSDLPVLLSGLISSAMMVVGALICLYAARPVDFFFPGNHPESWFAMLRRPLFDVMLGEAENYQGHIDANAAHLEQSGKTILVGATIGIVAPLAGIVLWAIVSVTTCLSCQAATGPDATRSLSSSGEISHTYR